MNIKFKLFASLAMYLPPDAAKNVAVVEVDDATTPNQLIAKHSLPKSEVHLVLLNGVYLDAESRNEPMQDNDALAVWPPVAGG